MRSIKEVVLIALQEYRGDNLERAEAAFKHLSDKELDDMHGQSGQTRRQVLEGYREHYTEVDNAIDWAKTLYSIIGEV